MAPHTRLRVGVLAVVAVAALAVAAGVALLLSNTVGLRSSADATLRSDDYLVRVISVERLVVDAETGLRGYLLTGRGLFLQPLTAARRKLPSAVTALRATARSTGNDVRQADALGAAASSYLASYVPSVLASARRSPASARSFATTLAGKHAVDAIRARAASLESTLSARERQRQTDARHSASRSITEAIVALALLTVLTALLGGFLAHLVVERDRARARSESTSRTLQQSILPLRIPPIPGFEVAARFLPAGGGLVGGDFYDVFEIGPGRWGLVVGDVCGKGAEGAAVTAMARWSLRRFSDSRGDPVAALRALNAAMLREDFGGRFITIAYVLFVVDAGVVRATVACAGHPAPIFVPAEGVPEAIDATGDLVGVWPAIRLHPTERVLRPGDSLIAYTDGVTDQSGELGVTPEQALAERNGAMEADDLASVLEDLARPGEGEQRDDIAILVLRYLGDGRGKVSGSARSAGNRGAPATAPPESPSARGPASGRRP